MNIGKIRDCIKAFEFKKLFVDGLGWEHSPQMTSSLKFQETIILYSCIAQINKVPVLKINSQQNQQLHNFNDHSKSPKMKQLHQKVKKRHHEHLLLFQNEPQSFILSYLSLSKNGGRNYDIEMGI